MLRMLRHALHSNYGPTADTGGLMQNHAPTIYGYPDLDALFNGESAGGRKSSCPSPPGRLSRNGRTKSNAAPTRLLGLDDYAARDARGAPAAEGSVTA